MLKFFKNARMKTKFMYVSMIILGMFSILTIMSSIGYLRINTTLNDAQDIYIETLDDKVQLYSNYLSITSDTYRALYLYETKDKENLKVAVDNIYLDCENLLIKIEELNQFFIQNEFYEEAEHLKSASMEIEKFVNNIKKLEQAINFGSNEEVKKTLANIEIENARIKSYMNDELINEIHQVDDSVTDVNETVIELFIILIVSFVLLLVVSVIVSILAGNSIDNDIKKLVDSVNKLSIGEFDDIEEINQRDEIGKLSRGICTAVSTVEDVIITAGLAREEYLKGVMLPNIPADKFEGAYKALLNDYYGIYKDIHTVTEDVLKGLVAISVGNFNYDIGEQPGERKVISDTYYSIRHNIFNVMEELNLIINNFENGDLSVKSNYDNFEGEWREILISLNRLVTIIACPIEETKSVLGKLKNGNLSTRMQGEYNGIFNDMKKDINDTFEMLELIINEIKISLDEISNKNLNVNKLDEYPGEFNEITKSINNIIDNLNIAITSIKENVTEVNESSEKIQNVNDDIARGSSCQIATVQELNANIEVINNKSIQNSDKSEEALNLSNKSKGHAIQGDTEMKEMLYSMESIKEATNNIQNIINVIDEIAFQTNLLALNAAVEAARAGQYGKGFAVVAEEVRTLANRSKTAAEETYTLINECLEKVNIGNDIAVGTAKALEEIVLDVEEVSGILKVITDTSKEQAESVNEVKNSLNNFQQVILNNTNASEIGAKNADNLVRQAEELNNIVSSFNV